MQIKYKIDEDYLHIKDFLLNIKEEFLAKGESIHKARNEIKIIKYKDSEYVVKSFKIPNQIRKFIYTYLRDSKAHKSYINSQKIEKYSPKAVAYIEFFQSNLLHESFFISEKYEYDFTIRSPLKKDDIPQKEQMLKEFVLFTCNLHNEGIYHKDYSPGNTLVKKIDNGYEFKIVDVNRMIFKNLSLNERMKNFSKLCPKDKDMIFMAKEYAKLINEDENLCVKLALKYSRSVKKMLNIKSKIRSYFKQ